MTSDIKHIPVRVLTVAGSDSGGAAGLQADLRAWAVLAVYGMSVITAVTAQNSIAVHAVQFMGPELIAAQLDAVLADYGADAVKTGFLGRVEIVETAAKKLAHYATAHLVVDPVLVNHKGVAMFPAEVTAAYRRYLLPLAEVVTPNCHEAGLLAGVEVRCVAEAETAARRLHDLGARNVLLKRIPAGNHWLDLLFDGQTMQRLPTPKIETENVHGAGDTLSAAVCAWLAQGEEMATAVAQAQQFTARAIQNSAGWQLGAGHGPVFATGSMVNCQ